MRVTLSQACWSWYGQLGSQVRVILIESFGSCLRLEITYATLKHIGFLLFRVLKTGSDTRFDEFRSHFFKFLGMYCLLSREGPSWCFSSSQAFWIGESILLLSSWVCVFTIWSTNRSNPLGTHHFFLLYLCMPIFAHVYMFNRFGRSPFLSPSSTLLPYLIRL